MTIVIDSGGSFGGSTHERHPLSDVPGGYLYATLRGQRAGSAVTFVKTYDGSAGWHHSVDYDGTINEDSTEITGQWRISGMLSGPFLMMRANGKEDAVIRKALQPVGSS